MEAAAGVSGCVRKTLPSSYPARQSSDTSSGSGTGLCSSSEDTFERVINEELPVIPPPPAERESRDGHHHARRCVRERGRGKDRQDRRWEFRQCQAQRTRYFKVISKSFSGGYILGAVRFRFPLCLNARSDLFICLLIEFGKYHHAESYDWLAGGREDTSLCAAWCQTLVQGTNSYSPYIDHLSILSSRC